MVSLSNFSLAVCCLLLVLHGSNGLPAPTTANSSDDSDIEVNIDYKNEGHICIDCQNQMHLDNGTNLFDSEDLQVMEKV